MSTADGTLPEMFGQRLGQRFPPKKICYISFFLTQKHDWAYVSYDLSQGENVALIAKIRSECFLNILLVLSFFDFTHKTFLEII